MYENPVYQMTSRIMEQEDKFIFERINSWLRETEKIEISKQEIISAIKMYRNKEQFEKVVHCGECKHFCELKRNGESVSSHFCTKHNWHTHETDYCSDGTTITDTE